MKMNFLYGTETGTAEYLCESLVAEFCASHDCTAESMEDLDPSALSPDPLYIVVCSTTGEGDVPATAEGFLDALQGGADLSGVRFAMFGLGDSTFATYQGGSIKVRAAMLKCGAREVAPSGAFDASGEELPEEIAEPWLEGVLQAEMVGADG